MKTRKIGVLPIILIVVLLSTLLCGTVVAYMFRITDTKNNPFVPAEVSCEVVETFVGAQEKTSIKIKNAGNIDSYLRVRFVSYWVDSEGKAVSKSSEMPTIFINTNWIAGTDNTYYFQKPVAPSALTDELLSAPIVLSEDAANGYVQVLEVFAEAIQSKPQNAVEDSWGVTLDATGNIQTAP